jgi:hypothetical protein
MLGRLPRNPRNPGIATVPGPANLDDLFDNLTRGGYPIRGPNNYKGPMVQAPGGYTVGRRRSDKFGPTLDITCPDGSIIKVHIKH